MLLVRCRFYGYVFKLGKLADFIPDGSCQDTSMLIHSLGTTSFNALMFGGHGSCDS